MHEQETAVGEVDLFGQDELFGSLGDRYDLGSPASAAACATSLRRAGSMSTA